MSATTQELIARLTLARDELAEAHCAGDAQQAYTKLVEITRKLDPLFGTVTIPLLANKTELAEAVLAKLAEGPPPDPYACLVDRSDQGNANLLIRQANGSLRYVSERKQWLSWNGTRWQIDEHEVFATTSALEVGKRYLQEAQRAEVKLDAALKKWAAKCRNKASIESMLTLARKSLGVPMSATDLDRDPWLLGVENGVVNLRTGELRKTEAREDYVTRRCSVSYNPDAPAPRWKQFIKEVTGAPLPAEYDATGEVIPETVGRFTPRPALARYFQKALGYGITGTTREHKFFIAIGGGSNGKNIAFEAVKHVIGGYGKVLPAAALMATSRAPDPERPTALAASLAGARFVISSETKDDQRLDVNLVKNNTGDAEMVARSLHQNPFTFEISHKIFLSTNNRPVLDHIDGAIRGRLHLIPFDRKWNRPGEFERDPALPDGDKTLNEQLAAEDEGILAWLVEGARLYQAEGLEPPPEVVATTKAYVEAQDHLGRWLATLQRCPPAQGERASELFDLFSKWCAAQQAELDPRTQTAFSLALGKRGIAVEKLEDGNYYGVRLLTGKPAGPKWEDDADAARQLTAEEQAARTDKFVESICGPIKGVDSGASKTNGASSPEPTPTPAAVEAAVSNTVVPEAAQPAKSNGATHADPHKELMEGLRVGPKTADDLVRGFYSTAKEVADAAPGKLMKLGPKYTAAVVEDLQARARRATGRATP